MQVFIHIYITAVIIIIFRLLLDNSSFFSFFLQPRFYLLLKINICCSAPSLYAILWPWRSGYYIYIYTPSSIICYCTFDIFGFSCQNQALPIFLDALLPAWGAILISVTLILAFGEVSNTRIINNQQMRQPMIGELVFMFLLFRYTDYSTGSVL